MVQFWLILLVFFVIVEAATVNLISIWFIFGSIAALIANFFAWSQARQIIVFFAVSILGMLAFFLHFKPRMKKRKGPAERTNADRIIGQDAKVTVDINPVENKGQILVLGQVWSAVPIDGKSKVAAGEKVRVKDIQGVKAVVELLA